MPPLVGARKIPTENKDSFLAPSGGRCSISVATGVSGSSGLQRNVTCSVASCQVSGHRTSNIPPSKRSVKTSAPFREAGSVETTVKYISVGRKDCRERLQDSVCISASAFQRRGLHFRETGTSAFVDTGVASSAGQRGHRTCSPARQRVRLLQPVFSGSQERRWVASNFRLNRYLRSYKFKMLTIKMIVSQIQSGDWFVTFDLKDAYFHVEILPQHRKFLRFAFGGKAYQYQVLPFGLALSPRTYTKCMDAALAPLRLQGIRILDYIDDWLILAQSQELALRHRDVVLAHLESLGLRLNAKKSVLYPAQRTTYLGVVWDSITMQAQLSPARVESFLNALKNIKLGQRITVHYLQRVLGLMAAASTVIPLGLLANEIISVVAQSQGISSKGQSPEANKGYAPGASYHFYVFQTLGPTLGPCCRRKIL